MASKSCRTITRITASYEEAVRACIIIAIREALQIDGKTADAALVFSIVMHNNFYLPVTCAGLYEALAELVEEGQVKYNEATNEVSFK